MSKETNRNAQLFWSIFFFLATYFLSVSSNLAKSTWVPHSRPHKFFSKSPTKLIVMVSDDSQWSPQFVMDPQKKKLQLSKCDPVAVSYSICWNYCTFFFEWMGSLLLFPVRLGNEFIGVLHTYYRWISGPYVCVIYAFNSILDCNPRFMGFHVHKSQEIFFPSIFWYQTCCKRFMKVWQNFH